MGLLDQAIGTIACDIAGATRVFHKHKLDFCCGGGLPLREAAARRGIDQAALVRELENLREQAETERDWRDAPPAELIEHILSRYHDRHREQMPELVRLARRVESAHGDKADCPVGLADHLAFMEQDLEGHMMKEERVLFPMLLQGRYVQSLPPIARMRAEHDDHGASLERLEELTDDMTPPSGACTTWRALYLGLVQLREDLMQHIHLENNVLFPRVEQQAEWSNASDEASCPSCSACS